MFTEPIENDLIISIDGGGDLKDYFKVFNYKKSKIEEILEVKINLGKPYRILGLLSPELYIDRKSGYKMDLPLSGKKMSLLSLGKITEEFKEPLREFYHKFMEYYNEEKDSVEINFRKLLDRIGFFNENFLDRETARDILATSQYIFEETIKENVYPLIEKGDYKRIVVVGGCGLNVTMNSKMYSDFGIPVFIPPCPNDCGISLGAAKIDNPNLKIFKNPFTDIKRLNESYLQKFRENFKRKKLSLEEIADLLSRGKIIGTMIGGLEIGPRALGNRSYLANPLINGMKNKINSKKIKDREYWRPVAPIVTFDSLNEFFDTDLPSPYMTFAPKVKEKYMQELKEITHFDGSSRIQTVSKEDGWIYHLLKLFGGITGKEILMNTSFNKKGNPLVQDYKEAYDLLKESDLDILIINECNPSREERMESFFKK